MSDMPRDAMAGTPPMKMTRAEFDAFTRLPGHRKWVLDYIDGHAIGQPINFALSVMRTRIAVLLYIHMREHPAGDFTGSDYGYNMPNGDMLVPDIAYISHVRLPIEPERECPIPPDFVVEVKSPDNSYDWIYDKVQRYIKSGVRLIWLVLPEQNTVEVYYADGSVKRMSVGDTLTGEPVFSDLTLEVKIIFSRDKKSMRRK